MVLIELPMEKYSLVYNIKEFDVFPMIASVIYRLQSGKVYVDNMEKPEIVYIVHKSGFSYLYTAKEIDYSEFITFLYNNDYTPQYSHIFNASEELVAAAKKDARVNVKEKTKMRMNGEPQFDNFKNIELGEGYTIKRVTEVDRTVLAAFNLDFIERFWDSVEDFLKYGFGWVIMEGDKPACIWYTVAVVNNNCESDLITLEDFRGRGLASIAGVYVNKTCMERGINMDWNVLTDNVPSIKIAEKFGKKTYMVYTELSLFKNK